MLPTLLLILWLCQGAIANTNFTDCLFRLQAGKFGPAGLEGAVDANGNKVANVSEAVGLTYGACQALCGSGYEAFNGQIFSSQLAAWLLPWLALVSQLPYGADDPLKNFEAMLLSVGSPMLAGYSLALAVTSNRWMVERFRRSNHPNSPLAAQVMGSLQQVLIALPQEKDVLPSLIVLRENDEWWRRLAHRLDYTGSQWTLAAIMSMVYVALAYILTWAITFQSNSGAAYPSGQSLGSLWLSLLPIVICYLQISPKSNFDRVNEALEHANETYFVATYQAEPAKRHGLPTITIQTARRDLVDEDRICSTPVCFYARFYTWFQAVLHITDAFDAASQHASDPTMSGTIPRTKTIVMQHCSVDKDKDNTYLYDLVNIYLKSAMLAAFLQWGTTGAAVMAMYLTPTLGLGCRSGSQLLYGCLATLVWLFAALSGILAHNFVTSPKDSGNREFTGMLAILLRQIAKILAALNTVWIFMSSFFQFTNLENCCYCKASALGLGRNAYASLVYTNEQQSTANRYWAGGIVMASGTAFAFIFAINILMKRPKIKPRTPYWVFGGFHGEMKQQ